MSAVAFLVLSQDHGDLLFLIFPVLLLATWGSGLLGASAGTIALTAIGLWFTARGEGAIAALVPAGEGVAQRIQVLQLFLAAVVLSGLPMAVVLGQLRKTKTDAEAAAEAKAQFLATMSHEIRTPLNGVIGMTGLLMTTDLSEQQRGYAETARQSGETLLGVINDILDFSKIDAGKVELEVVDFDLYDIVESVTGMIAVRAASKGLELASLRSALIAISKAARAMRILIAEDDEASRMILEAAVRQLGHESVSANDGAEAWRLFQLGEVDAVISDRSMPVMDGFELCRRIRALPGSGYPYFIFLTSFSDKSGIRLRRIVRQTQPWRHA